MNLILNKNLTFKRNLSLKLNLKLNLSLNLSFNLSPNISLNVSLLSKNILLLMVEVPEKSPD